MLLIGTNDIGAGADPAGISYNIKTILNRIRKKYPKIPAIVCEVMPNSEMQHRPAATSAKTVEGKTSFHAATLQTR